MVLGVDLGGHFGAVGSGRLGGVHAVRVEHAGKFHLELVRPIQGEGVVEAILVVGRGDDLRDDELAVAGGHHGAITEVGMLVEKAVILLVNADSVLDHGSLALSGCENTIHIVDGALAIAAQLQGVGHQTRPVLTHVKGVFLVVRFLRGTVWNHHLNHANAVEQRAVAVLVGVVHRDIRDHDTLAVVEANVHLVAGPRELISAHLERHTLRLGDVNRLQLIVLVLVTDEFRKIVVFGQRHGSPLAIDVADINAQDLFPFGVGNDGKVQRMRVLVVEGVVAVVGQTLLKTALEAPALINTDGPGVEEDLGHIGDAETFARFNHSRVIPSDALHHIQVLQRESGHDVVDLVVLIDLGLGQVGHDLGDLAGALVDDDGKSTAIWPRRLTLPVGRILEFLWLSESQAVELDSSRAEIVSDEFCSVRDLNNRQLI